MSDTKTLEIFSPERSQLVDSKGRYLTQSLFLELGYNPDAIYTLKDIDHFHNNKTYISPKRVYLEMQDMTEYTFANTLFAGWAHWQKMLNNKAIRAHIEEWRAELEYKMRSLAVQSLIGQAKKGSFQASKWLADRGWENRGAGRPTEEEVNKNIALRNRDENEWTADIHRLIKKHG